MIQVITHPDYLPGETAIWEQLLNEGAGSILLRKPGWQEAEYEELLLRINPVYYDRLMIAEHASLCKRYNLQGVHFGEASRAEIPAEQLAGYRQNGWVLSTSIHSTATLQVVGNDWNQLLLSPVFDSISKKGYLSAFDETFRLSKDDFEGKVLALGGVNKTNAVKAKTMLFDGIALLGAIWEQPENAVIEFCRIRDNWFNK